MALESYWPEYLRELREFRALAGAEEPELTTAGAALRRAPDDFYTATLTAAAVCSVIISPGATRGMPGG